MVIPAELFQVNYAAETRQFLSDYFESITIVTFKKLVFSGIQQEVVLLLAEKKSANTSGIKVVELDDLACLDEFDFRKISKLEAKTLDHTRDKWTQYFLDEEEILLIRELKQNSNIRFADDLISVDVGIVTGRNEFFMINNEKKNYWKLNGNTVNMVSRSGHLKGLSFKESDFKNNQKMGFDTSMFKPLDSAGKLDSKSVKYVDFGEKNGYHTGYKCRIRKNWYVVPSYWIPDAFALRQIHDFPKIILNETNASCTDTIHRVRFINGHSGKEISAAFLNSLTFAFSEITGRSYGGGVLTFEPSEVEKLPIPIKLADQLDFDRIDELLRLKKIEDVLDITDPILLKKGLGLTNIQIKKLRNIWMKMRDRRINRR